MLKARRGLEAVLPLADRRGPDHQPVVLEDAKANETPLEFAPINSKEQEVVARLERKTRSVYIQSMWPSMTRQLMKKYGPPHRTTVSSKDGKVTAAFWDGLSRRSLTFRNPTSKNAGNRASLERARRARQKR
jgi:hypothetical protein